MKNWRDYIGHIVFGGSAGGVMYVIYILASQEPRLIVETFKSWGPLSLICLLGMVVMDRGFSSMIAAAKESAAAQQKLADSVNEIAKRDSAEAYEQRVLMGHIGTQTEKILTRFDQLEDRLAQVEEKRRAAGAA